MTLTMFRFVVFLLSCQLCKAQAPDELTGGATGDNENQFVEGTADTAKILLGLNCVKDTVTSTAVTLQLYVNQGDEAFKFDQFATTVRADELILYDACFFIDVAAYSSASKTLTKASNCPDPYLQTIDSTAADTTYERRTKTAELVISNPNQGSTYTCGARKNGDDIEVAVYCKREEGFDKAFDVVFLATYGKDKCIASMVTTDITVKNPPVVDVYHNLQVQMKAYIEPDTVVNGPRSLDANEITSSITLGTAMYLEICLIKPPVNNNNHFLEDGISPISPRPYQCTARPDLDNSDFQTSIDATTEEVLTDENGCGAAQTGHKGIEEYFKPENYIFRFLVDQSEPKSYLLTPNCVKTNKFPAISFARLKAVDFVDTIFTCKLDYCTSSKDNKCFGPDGSGTDQYPTCPSAKRRKRETITVGPELPEELSVSVRVVLPGANTTSTESEGCFEQTTFIGVSSAMGTVLLGIVIAAILLAVKLNSYAPEASTDSMTGIHNKAYY